MRRPTQLDLSYRGIVYPNFHDREGRHPVAARYDRIGGLATATVFYQTGRRRAAYSVVPATALGVPADASRLLRRQRSPAEIWIPLLHAPADCRPRSFRSYSVSTSDQRPDTRRR